MLMCDKNSSVHSTCRILTIFPVAYIYRMTKYVTSEIPTLRQAASCGRQLVEGNQDPSTVSHCLSH